MADGTVTHVSSATQPCDRAWYFNYHLGYAPIYDKEPLLMGNWMHFALALVNRGLTWEQAVINTVARQGQLWVNLGLLYEMESPETVALYGRFKNLMAAHQAWQSQALGRYDDHNLKWVSTEHTHKFTYRGHKFSLQWDGLVELQTTGDWYVFERKTSKYPEQLATGIQWDLQPRFYLWAAQREYGPRVRGVLYEFIRNCDPYHVKILQNGLPSMAEAELKGTSPEVYRQILDQCITDTGANRDAVLAKYQPTLDKLAYMPPIFLRQPVYLTSGELACGRDTMVARASHRKQLLKGKRICPLLDRHTCQERCVYRDVCLTMDQNGDWTGMLIDNFIKDKERMDDIL